MLQPFAVRAARTGPAPSPTSVYAMNSPTASCATNAIPAILETIVVPVWCLPCFPFRILKLVQPSAARRVSTGLALSQGVAIAIQDTLVSIAPSVRLFTSPTVS
jgi:hypothetical protein